MTAGGHREPTPQELGQERIIRNGLIVDALILAGLIATALWSGSLTIGAEFLRGLVLWFLSLTSLYVLIQVNRGRLGGYDFGTGKLEQVMGLIVALTMGVGALFLAVSIQERWQEPVTTTQSGLSAGTFVVVVNFAVNIWFFVTISRASRGLVSPVVEAERRSWLTKVIASGVVVVSVVVLAIFRESHVGRASDLLGSAFVACFMIWISASMIREAMPDLLDKALGEDLQLHITRVLAAHFENYDHLGVVRSRRIGNHMIVEIELGFAAALAIGDIERRLELIRRDLREQMPGCGIVLIPRAAG
ncbi:MAG: cation transporter [Alphaproteobacteria bacterium]|nr:cation transporter [Alphaproteobacteria bacterium]